jgi:hypothetical protein
MKNALTPWVVNEKMILLKLKDVKRLAVSLR